MDKSPNLSELQFPCLSIILCCDYLTRLLQGSNKVMGRQWLCTLDSTMRGRHDCTVSQHQRGGLCHPGHWVSGENQEDMPTYKT